MLLQKIRIKLARLLWRAALGPVAGRMPGNCVFSAGERSGDPLIARHVEEIAPANPAEIVSWKMPDAFPGWIRREFAFAARPLIILRDVVVAPSSGAVWSPDGHVFMESIGSLNKALTFGKALPEMLLSPESQIPNPESSCESPIIPCACASYFHWMFEVLPSVIHACRRFPDCRILLHPRRPSYIEQGLRLWLGDTAFSRRIVEAERPLRVERTAFLAMPTASGFVPPRDAELVRSTFAGGTGSAGLPRRKIFISRRGSAARRVACGEELEKRHAGMGYEILQLERQEWQEQVRAFSAASHVAGLHGAGFSNVVFAPRDCKVIEFFPPGYTNDCYARLACGLGQTYGMESLAG